MGAFILLTPGFPENENDTSCLPAFQQFALALKKNYPKIELIIVSLHYPFSNHRYTWNGIQVIAIGGRNKRNFWNLYTRNKAYRALKKIKASKTIIGVLSLWCTDTALIGNKFSIKFNIPHFIWIIGQDAKTENKLVAKIKPKAEQLIAMSDFLQEEFTKNHDVRPKFIVENGINENSFPTFNLQERPIDIFGAGSLSVLKNYELFIEIVGEIKKIKSTVYACIAGGGEQFEYLQQKIISLNLQNNVQLLGTKSHRETLVLMNQSKSFLHTSNYEGNSTVLMEALYSGCSVFSTQALSKRHIKNLIISNDKQELVKELSQFLMNPHHPEKVNFNTMDNSVKLIMKLFTN